MARKQQGARPQEPSGNIVQLTGEEERQVRRRTSLRAAVVFETVRRQGEAELTRPALSLAFSGLAAGMSMGFSLVACGVLQAALPDAPWRPLIVNVGYTIGFLIVILGSQQLFTENTLTALLPLLDDPDKGKKSLQVLRMWGIVLASNLVGAALFALVLAHTGVFEAPVRQAFLSLGMTALHPSFAQIFLRAILAGWLIALVVWLLPAANPQRLWIIVIITWVVGAANLSHVIAGSVETLYVVAVGGYPWTGYLGHFLLPVLLGNCVGGVGLVALLNYGQVVPESDDA